MAATAIALAIGCGDGEEGREPDPKPFADPVRVEAAPSDGVPVDGAPVPLDGAAIASTTLAGAAAIATDRGLFRARTDGTFAVVPFLQTTGGVEPRIVTLTRRREGLLALTDRGLFHDASGFLVRSPLSDAIAPLGVKRVDVTNDTLWLTAERGAYRAVNGQLERITLPGLTDAPDAVVGIRDDAVLVVVPSAARLVDLATMTIRELGAFGRVTAFDREANGTVHVATEQGLLSCASDLTCTQRTFAAPGQPARAVSGVSVAASGVSALLGDTLVAIDASGSRVVARAPSGATAVTVDATGDAWFVARGAAARAALGSPPSFARDVSPFFGAHCLTCHANGMNGAPRLGLGTYETAVQLAPLIVKRIRAEGAPPMPPSSVERLAPSDYAAVVRWAATGTKP